MLAIGFMNSLSRTVSSLLGRRGEQNPTAAILPPFPACGRFVFVSFVWVFKSAGYNIISGRCDVVHRHKHTHAHKHPHTHTHTHDLQDVRACNKGDLPLHSLHCPRQPYACPPTSAFLALSSACDALSSARFSCIISTRFSMLPLSQLSRPLPSTL